MKPLIVIGTRPEAIKLAPVARALPEAVIALTGQHPAEVTLPILDYFGVTDRIGPKRCHIANLDLAQTFADIFRWLSGHVRESSCVIGQGDTTTAAAAAQAAYYAGIPFVHVEAGLRTYQATPFPEEFNRRVCALAATVHCAPTERAADNLRAERVQGRIEVTGNTVVDALLDAVRRDDCKFWHSFPDVKGKRLVLVTCHRRENHHFVADQLADAIAYLANHFRDDTVFLWLAHGNSESRPRRSLPGVIVNQCSYAQTAWLIKKSHLIVTDSGGIQEEAAILGRRCFVVRESTERPEAVECGACRLLDPITMEDEVQDYLSIGSGDPAWRFADPDDPWPIRPHSFGDGKSGERIANIVRELTNNEREDKNQCPQNATSPC